MTWIIARTAAVLLAAVLAAACAFVPGRNARLEEARALHDAAQADPRLARFAPRELEQARDAYQRAAAASSSLQDPAEVDHLAYLAKQRLALAREIAALREAHDARVRAVPTGR